MGSSNEETATMRRLAYELGPKMTPPASMLRSSSTHRLAGPSAAGVTDSRQHEEPIDDVEFEDVFGGEPFEEGERSPGGGGASPEKDAVG